MGTESPRKPLLLIEDDSTLNRLLTMQLEAEGFRVIVADSADRAKQIAEREDPALVLLDVRLPDRDGLEILPFLCERCPVIVLTAFGSIDQAVTAIKQGAQDYLVKPVRAEVLKLSVQRALETAELRRSYAYLQREIGARRGGMVGRSPAMEALRRSIALVAPTETTVLLLGESGTGKELAARALHAGSPRAERPFVVIDCTTLQDTLFESELFGHERGAFTGAERRKEGLIEVAEGGTIFLDEVGDLSPAAQAKLLRTLETRTYRRLGSVRDSRCDARFIAATNRDLEQMVAGGRFREDLFYRLAGFVIQLPPLRERPEDIRPLAQYFLARRNAYRHVRKRFTEAALQALEAYRWPGNVRELRNVVERSAILSGEAEEIRSEHLTLRPEPETGAVVELRFDHEPTLEEIRELYVRELMQRYRGHRALVAERLGVSERTLYRMLRQRSPVA